MEFVGTMMLVCVICVSAGSGCARGALAVVSLLVGLIYTGFQLSGAHYNPAVTLTFLLRNSISPTHAAAYVAAQSVGAACGAALAPLASPSPHALHVLSPYSLANALCAELFFTSLICFSILTITMRSGTELHPIFGSKLSNFSFSTAH